MTNQIYEEQVHLHWSEKILFVVSTIMMVGVLVGIYLAPESNAVKVIGLLLFGPIFLAVAWRGRPKKSILFITDQEIIYREGKHETRMNIASMKSAIACDTYIRRRGTQVGLSPRTGQKMEDVRPYRDKLNATGRPSRKYDVRAGSAIVVQLTNDAVMIFPSNQPENALAALQGVRAGSGR